MCMCDSFQNQNFCVARISGVHKNLYKAIFADSEITCHLPGKLSSDTLAKSYLPTVGDFVELDENSVIKKILPRMNLIVRKSSGKKVEEQLIAANIDYAFIVSSLNREFNARRIERYVAFLDVQNIPCRIVLTKVDLCNDLKFYLSKLTELRLKDEPILTSIIDGRGIDEIAELLTVNKTAVFIGSSGVGKSSIVNALAGEMLQKTNIIRTSDDKGKHTTTSRALFQLENGAYVIDTPGIREIQFWVGGMSNSFEDVENIALMCRFSNCAHETENGCAVKEAIERGILSEFRLKSYKKLQNELERVEVWDMIKSGRVGKNKYNRNRQKYDEY